MPTRPPNEDVAPSPRLDEMTPSQIVAELDKHVIGQRKAKRAVAVALRNRVRRRRLNPEMAGEIQPKNIIMIGSTGVGKTEIARRLAALANSPFIKVEASKFTEVGYVGRDVESIVRDLVDVSTEMVRQEKAGLIEEKAESNAEERVLDLLLPPLEISSDSPREADEETVVEIRPAERERFRKRREKLRSQLRTGKLDKRIVDLEMSERSYPSFEIITSQGAEEMDVNLRDLFSGIFGSRTRTRKCTVEEAMDFLLVEEELKLIDMDQVTRESLERVEESGIVFLDEIDKIAGREMGQGPEVSREGVQRDILPILEGTTVATRYGMVRTDHVLFIAAGAFHVSKPSDLIPELQGRFPIRVEMDTLSEEDFVRILTEPRNSLIKQYSSMLGTEDLSLRFTRNAIDAIAHFAVLVNSAGQDIGARRLHTIMEALMEDISFQSPEMEKDRFVITAKYVESQLADIVRNEDLSRHIL